jgi:hypothetical protein
MAIVIHKRYVSSKVHVGYLPCTRVARFICFNIVDYNV